METAVLDVNDVIEVELPIEVELAEPEKPKRLTPMRSIRAYCVQDCCNWSAQEVRLCPRQSCELYSRRFGKRPAEPDPLTPIKAIRAKCIDCSTGSAVEVRVCEFTDCRLYEYRMGKNPALAGRRGNADALRRWREERGRVA